MSAKSRQRKEQAKRREADREATEPRQALFKRYGFVPLKTDSQSLRKAHVNLAAILLAGFDARSKRAVGLGTTVMHWYREYDSYASTQSTEEAFFRDGGLVKLRLACTPGCNHCCVTPVSLTGMEVVVITEYIRFHFSEQDLRDLVDRITVREHAVGGRQDRNHMCPLNVGGRCSIYEVRPFNCRKWHSFDEAACRQAFLKEDKMAEIPRQSGRGDATGFIAMTADRVFQALKVDTDHVDFIPALTIALQTRDLANRFAAGEPLFLAARWRT